MASCKLAYFCAHGSSTVPSTNKNLNRIVRLRFLLVGGGGFEPPKSSTTDLQSAPFGHSGIGAGERNRTINLLITNQLLCLLSYTSVCAVRRPTAGAVRRGHRLVLWCLGADLNHRHRDFQSLALPTELPRHAV